MGLFRRKPKGRHALGAAVTSIPSVPVVVPRAAVAPLPPWESGPAAPAATASPAPAAAPPAPVAPPPASTPVPTEVAAQIPTLIAHGDAWQDTATGVAEPAMATPSVPVPALPPVVAPVAAAPPASAASRPPGVSGPPQSPGSARDLLEAALGELSILQDTPAAATPAPVPAPRRVQLGFRDGTSAVLDPASTQAQALEQLAQSLTRKE